MDDYILQFKDKFVEEAILLLQHLEESLLELENEPKNKEHIEEVFRVMHTLKGVAGMYGFINIQDFTHHLETIYDLIRKDELDVNEQILDLTLASVDHIKALLNDDTFSNTENIERHEVLINKVLKIAVSAGIESSKTDKIIVEKKTNSQENSISTYYIRLRVEEDFINRGVRLTNIFKDLANLGRYQIIEHNFPIEEEQKNDTVWGVYLACEKAQEDIEDVFMFIADNITIRKIASKNLFEEEDFVGRLEEIVNPKNETKDISNQKSIIELVETKYKNKDVKLLEKEDKKLDDKKNLPEIHHTESKTTSRIMVDTEKLDTLMILVTELVTTQSQFDLALKNNSIKNLKEVYLNIQKLTKQFRDNALKMRLIPINDLIISFKRLVRDVSKKLGKEIDFVTQGMDTELDKSTIDAINEPLMHIIRNSIDHGIEQPEQREKQNKSKKGKIELTAYHSGSFVYIEVKDDGKGIDKDFIRKKAIEKGIIEKSTKLTDKDIYELLFFPGFSTAQNLTEISGRGVGMDVVNKKIQELRGEIVVNSEIGVGSSFTIKLQQTIAIIDTMLIQTDDMYFLIPLSEIETCVQYPKKDLYSSTGNRIEHGGTLIPFISLRDEFDLKSNDSENEQLIILNKYDKKFAITADRIIGEHQAVLKPLGELFKTQEFLSGASILGDGNIAMMVDTLKLIKQN